jgi:tight adherence protein C
MDLLSVCISAGLGFDQAISYVVQRMEGYLISELDTTFREISMGMIRKEALERFGNRCDCEEIYIFVGAINQADELGSSMRNVMETQADSVRLSHKQAVEEKAQKMSVKMMIPMVMFILPVTFIIILGPAVPSVISALGGIL